MVLFILNLELEGFGVEFLVESGLQEVQVFELLRLQKLLLYNSEGLNGFVAVNNDDLVGACSEIAQVEFTVIASHLVFDHLALEVIQEN